MSRSSDPAKPDTVAPNGRAASAEDGGRAPRREDRFDLALIEAELGLAAHGGIVVTSVAELLSFDRGLLKA
jgi:hypothetical protein